MATVSGELIVWREIAERERARAEAVEAQAVDLRVQLAGIAQAGPIRALRLRRALRSIPAGGSIAQPVHRGLGALTLRRGERFARRGVDLGPFGPFALGGGGSLRAPAGS